MHFTQLKNNLKMQNFHITMTNYTGVLKVNEQLKTCFHYVFYQYFPLQKRVFRATDLKNFSHIITKIQYPLCDLTI